MIKSNKCFKLLNRYQQDCKPDIIVRNWDKADDVKKLKNALFMELLNVDINNIIKIYERNSKCIAERYLFAKQCTQNRDFDNPHLHAYIKHLNFAEALFSIIELKSKKLQEKYNREILEEEALKELYDYIEEEEEKFNEEELQLQYEREEEEILNEHSNYWNNLRQSIIRCFSQNEMNDIVETELKILEKNPIDSLVLIIEINPNRTNYIEFIVINFLIQHVKFPNDEKLDYFVPIILYYFPHVYLYPLTSEEEYPISVFTIHLLINIINKLILGKVSINNKRLIVDNQQMKILLEICFNLISIIMYKLPDFEFDFYNNSYGLVIIILNLIMFHGDIELKNRVKPIINDINQNTKELLHNLLFNEALKTKDYSTYFNHSNNSFVKESLNINFPEYLYTLEMENTYVLNSELFQKLEKYSPQRKKRSKDKKKKSKSKK